MRRERLGRRLALNASAAFGNQAALAVLSIAATGVLVRTLGVARFGAWSLVGAVVAHVGLFDLGLGVALVRRIAAAEEAGDHGETSRAVSASLAATLVLGGVAGALVISLAPHLALWLRVPPAQRAEFITALRIGGTAAALTLPGVGLGAVPTAMQRLSTVIRLEAVTSALTLLAQVGLALAGYGLVALALAFLAGRAASLVGRIVLARRLAGALLVGLDPRYPFWRELGRFGALKVAHQAASQSVLYLDRLMVGALASVGAVAYYTVAAELAQRLLVVQGNISVAYYPAACAAAPDRETFARLYVRTSRVVALLTLPLAIGLALFAAPLLRVWVGSPFVAPSTGGLRVMALAYAGMALTAIPSSAADALNRPDLPVRFSLVGIVINVALGLLLIPSLGAIGAAWALAGNVVLQSPWFVWRVTRDLVGAPLRGYTREVLAEPLLPTAVVAAALALVLAHGQAPSDLVVAIVAGGLAFLLGVRVFGTFDPEERRFVASLKGGRLLRWVTGQ